MNSIIFSIILVPIIEIYLLIKIGSKIGAISTILLILTTALIGIYYAKYEGLNTLKSGFVQLSKNETPVYEVISGAAIAFGALLLIIPGFLTDTLGFLLIFPLTRKLIFKLSSNKNYTNSEKKNNFIDGEFEDIEDDDDRKI
jgi:UPF0716 protein FxsA